MAGNKNSGRKPYKDKSKLIGHRRIWHNRFILDALNSNEIQEACIPALNEAYFKKTGLKPY
jgi:hypothetical protein